jgi:hypothetical protein
LINVRASTGINRSVEDVYSYVADPRHRHIWQLSLIRVEQESLLEGSRVVEVRRILGRRVELVGQITEHVPNARLAFRGDVPGHATLERRWVFEADGADSASVTCEIQLDTGGAFKLATLTFERVLKRDVESSLGHLKDVMEAHQHLHEATALMPHHAVEAVALS